MLEESKNAADALPEAQAVMGPGTSIETKYLAMERQLIVERIANAIKTMNDELTLPQILEILEAAKVYFSSLPVRY